MEIRKGLAQIDRELYKKRQVASSVIKEAKKIYVTSKKKTRQTN